jgi:hypothetical protein
VSAPLNKTSTSGPSGPSAPGGTASRPLSVDACANRADAVAVYEGVCKETGKKPDAALLKKMNAEIAAKIAEVTASLPFFVPSPLARCGRRGL